MRTPKITTDLVIKSIPCHAHIDFKDLARKLGVSQSTLSIFLSKNEIPEIVRFSSGYRVNSFKRLTNVKIDLTTGTTTKAN
jgi:precorrin-4 methylase